ncbi:hypothetical protein [Nonomuraea jabiensis]|uniref:hypothetical protein n=1 Tax=Nonomuraea jabiensis TaxID=882448 RepID=UPI0036C19015
MRTTKLHSAKMVTYNEENDRHAEALFDAFKTHFADYWKRSGSVNNPFGKDPGIEFDIIVGSLCSANPPDTILYGGCGKDLPTFIQYLSHHKCHPERVTIVTSSDAVRLLTDSPENKQAVAALYTKEKPISLICSPLAEPAVRRGGASRSTVARYGRLEQTFRDIGFDPAHLRPGGPARGALGAHPAAPQSPRSPLPAVLPGQ